MTSAAMAMSGDKAVSVAAIPDSLSSALATKTATAPWNVSLTWRAAAAAIEAASVATASSRLIEYSTAVRRSRASASSLCRRMPTIRLEITSETNNTTASAER